MFSDIKRETNLANKRDRGLEGTEYDQCWTMITVRRGQGAGGEQGES